MLYVLSLVRDVIISYPIIIFTFVLEERSLVSLDLFTKKRKIVNCFLFGLSIFDIIEFLI